MFYVFYRIASDHKCGVEIIFIQKLVENFTNSYKKTQVTHLTKMLNVEVESLKLFSCKMYINNNLCFCSINIIENISGQK